MTRDSALDLPVGVPATAYLGLGANVGDSESAISTAIERLNSVSGLRVEMVSSLYRTAPVGVVDQPDFVNAVVRISTLQGPAGLLLEVLAIERAMGRERTIRWGPRVIDIDVLLYGDRTVSIPGLTLPHPRMYERAFVMVPLAEIAPDLLVPTMEQDGLPAESVVDRARRLSAASRVERVGSLPK